MAYTTIKKPSDYFNTVTWTGTNDATTSVTGVNFQPDFVWIKNRNVADDHTLHDAIRGSTKTLFSNSTGAEGTNTESIQSFDSDGFTTGNHRGTGGNAGNLMVSWNWLGANGTASNTDGSITSTVSANTTSGFSIVSYTGNAGVSETVGHGLNAPLGMVIAKNRDDIQDWRIYHKSLGTNQFINFNTNAAGTASTVWQTASFTNDVFAIGDNSSVGGSGNNIIAYCFAEVKGFSKFGSYVGNGNADGTFVYTGFKPAMLITKRTDAISDWRIWDNKRDTFNVVDGILYPSASNAEGTETFGDFTSNGFKIRTSSADYNASGGSYIYMAFAEEPLVGDNPATAR